MERQPPGSWTTAARACKSRLSMHCSVWRFEGDPDDLEQRYLAMLDDIPESNHAFHAAAKTPDGLLIFDTCPYEDVYRQFFGPGGPAVALFEKHGLVPATREDYPVIRAYATGARVDERPNRLPPPWPTRQRNFARSALPGVTRLRVAAVRRLPSAPWR
jgi:hypothetical protein